MTKGIRQLESFSPVSPGATATVRLSHMDRFASVVLKVASGSSTPLSVANQKTLIERVRLKVTFKNSGQVDTLWDITGAHLLMLNEFYGIPTQAGQVILPFSLPYMADVVAEDHFALGTMDLSQVILEVKLADTITNPELSGWGEIFLAGNAPLGEFIKLQTNSYNAQASAGIREISNLPVVGPSIALKAMHFTTDAISDLEIKANRVTIREGEKALQDVLGQMRTDRTVQRTPVAGHYHVDWMGNRYEDRLLTGAFQEFLVRANMTSAVDFEILSELVVGTRPAA